MIPFHSLHVAPKQDYLYSIHFYSFPFLYFKTSNQYYFIPFHSILFHSFPLLKYISFHSIPFHFLVIIPFHSIPSLSLRTPKRSLRAHSLSSTLQSSLHRNSQLELRTNPSSTLLPSFCWNLNPKPLTIRNILLRANPFSFFNPSSLPPPKLKPETSFFRHQIVKVRAFPIPLQFYKVQSSQILFQFILLFNC